MRIAVAALLLLASPLSFEAYAQDVEVMPLNESLSAIREAVNGDAGGGSTGGSDSRAWADFFQGLSMETQGLLPAEVEVVLHVVAVQSKGGGELRDTRFRGVLDGVARLDSRLKHPYGEVPERRIRQE